MTEKLYLIDPQMARFETTIVRVSGEDYELSATAFYPGGGGQPGDIGKLVAGDREYTVTQIKKDENGTIWHTAGSGMAAGATVTGSLDWPRRYALMKNHTLLHIVNAIMLNDYSGLITGVQIGEEQSRIDFMVDGFSRDELPILEDKINDVIRRDLPVSATVITEEEFRQRPELIRTAVALPPVENGRIRIVAIEGFDAQACGGTHVRTTGELGRCRITKFDNKGKNNKRLYLALQNQICGESADE